MIDKTKHYASHKLYLNGIQISREEEIDLFRRYKSETDQYKKDAIKDRLIRANIRFAISEAMKLTKSISSSKAEDIIAEALHGLTIAIDKFDYTRDVKFISYAVWHVKQKVFAFLNKDDLIQLPPMKKSETLKSLISGDSSVFDNEESVNLYNVLQNIVSIDAKIGHGDDSGDDTLSDIIPDTTMTDEIDSNTKNMMRSTILREVIDQFSTSDQIIIEDMMNGNPMSASASKISVSKQRVAQLKKSIIRKMKTTLDKHGTFKTHRRELLEQ